MIPFYIYGVTVAFKKIFFNKKKEFWWWPLHRFIFNLIDGIHFLGNGKDEMGP